MIHKSKVNVTHAQKLAVTLLILSKEDYMKHLASARREDKQGSKDESEAESARKAHIATKRKKQDLQRPERNLPCHKQHKGRLDKALKFLSPSRTFKKFTRQLTPVGMAPLTKKN